MTTTDIRSQLKQAMISKDGERLGVIRMLLSAINYAAMALDKKEEEMTSEEIGVVVMKEIKTRKDGIADFEKKGDQEKVNQEKKELKILEEFAPKMMTMEEVGTSVQKILSGQSLSQGPAMGLVMKELRGKADPSLIKSVVEKFLQN